MESGNAGKIEPYGPFTMSPATMVFHYGQAIFEGMKAYRAENGEVTLFRPGKNIARFNQSATRMCMPTVPEDIFMEAIAALVALDKDWVPSGEDASLYIRPFMIATDSYVGVKASDKYAFSIFTCPVGAYYKGSVRVKVERTFTRAAAGGTGYAKAAGNYAGSLYPSMLARHEGYDELIWTDAKEHEYIEESGTMNAMFVFDGTLVSPMTSETILDGVTRDSVIQLATDLNIPVEVRRITVEELRNGLAGGVVSEAFGVGTAATIKPIEEIGIDGINYPLVATKSLRPLQLLNELDDAFGRGRLRIDITGTFPFDRNRIQESISTEAQPQSALAHCPSCFLSKP